MVAEPGLIWSLVLFAVVVVVTPGANNLLAAASGMQFGFRASRALLIGIGVGVVSLVAITGAGLGLAVRAAPGVELGLRVVGSAYLLWLAVQVARSDPPGAHDRTQRALGLRSGLLVSWLNPKTWLVGVSAASGYSELSANPLVLAAILGAVFTCVIAPNLALWCLVGRALGANLRTGPQWRIAHVILAALLLASVALMWM